MEFISVVPTAGNCFLAGRYKEGRVLFSGVQSNTMTDSRHKQKNRKSQLIIRGCETLEQVVQSLSLEILKPGWTRCTPTTFSGQEDGLGECLRSLPTYMFLKLHLC